MITKYLPLVTIIMNVHNGEKFIQEAIKSIFRQTYSNWELIIWDNKSFDKTNLIVQKYNDKRIKYFKSTNFDTLYAARNKAISFSQGELITFLDVDDLWIENKLMCQVKIMNNKNIDFCYSNYFVLNDLGSNSIKKKAFYKNLPSGRIYKKLLKFYDVGILTLCIRKEVLSKFNICFDSRFTIIGDMLFVLEISKLGFCYADQNCLACYRSHDKNLSKRKVLLQVKEMRTWFNELKVRGEWNKEDLKNLISLTNYQRAKGLAIRSSFLQIFKLIIEIKKINLALKFLCFYVIKILPKKFVS